VASGGAAAREAKKALPMQEKGTRGREVDGGGSSGVKEGVGGVESGWLWCCFKGQRRELKLGSSYRTKERKGKEEGRKVEKQGRYRWRKRGR
jgi:hypothetical protein